MSDSDLVVSVSNLGFPGGPTWLWTVRTPDGKLVDGGICGTQGEAWEQVKTTPGVQVDGGQQSEEGSTNIRPGGEG